MAILKNQVLLHWVDGEARESTNFMVSIDQAAAGASAYSALADAFQACSDAGLIAIQYQVTLIRSGTPSTGSYATVHDRAVLSARIADTNQPTRVEIPAPKSSILQADNTLVNLTSAPIIALQSACTAALGDALGNAMGPFQRGIRKGPNA